MTLPGRNRFPRGSTEPTQTQDAASARDATGWSKGYKGLDDVAGLAGNDKPKLRGVEANTDDGRASRQPSFANEATSSGDLGTDVCGDEAIARAPGFDGYAETTRGPGTQGGVGGVRDGGMAGPAGESFDS